MTIIKTMARLRIKNAFLGIITLLVMVTSVPAGTRGCVDALRHDLNDLLDRHVSYSHHDHTGEIFAFHETQTTIDGAPHQQLAHKHRHAPNEKEHEHTHQQTLGTNVIPEVALAPATISSPLPTAVPATLIAYSLLSPVSESLSVIFRPPIFS